MGPASTPTSGSRTTSRTGARGRTVRGDLHHADSELRLTIPPEQGLWCPDDHDPLRVSGIQSGLVSGQQPFADGLVVKEPQPTRLGWAPHHGRIEVRARMDLSERSMAAVWMVGLEDEPNRCGEICVFEVFGDAPTAMGWACKPVPRPGVELAISSSHAWRSTSPSHHVYAADWRPGRVDFFVDGEHVRAVDEAPDYPMQFMVAVFDFPDKAPDIEHVPLFAVDSIVVLEHSL